MTNDESSENPLGEISAPPEFSIGELRTSNAELRMMNDQLRRQIQQFEQQAQLLNSTLTNIQDFAYTFGRDGRFRYANQPLLDLLKVSAEEIAGKNFFDLPYPEDLAIRLQDQIQTVFDTGKVVKDETLFTNPEGEQGFYEYIFAPVFVKNGDIEFVAGSTRDITTRKLTEINLRVSEERLRVLIESATEFAIFSLDNQGFVDSWNPGAENIFGYAEAEIIGKSGKILFTPEDRAAGVPEREMGQALDKGRAEDERWHLRRNGTRFFASGWMMPLQNSSSGGFVKIARDMTARMQSSKILREKEMLEKLVNAQEEERKRLARDLHDHLGQQLTVLRMKLEKMQRLCEDESELCVEVTETQKIVRNIDTDLSFLAWELRPASLDDLGLATALTDYLKEWQNHSGISAELHISGLNVIKLIPEIETNVYRIAQETLNNIWKHAESDHVSVILKRQLADVLLIIEDNGIGFDVEEKTKTSGGLGLAGISERAALVGGTVEIESQTGIGTTIYVRIPFDGINRK